MGSPDLIILPGSKTTIADLDWLKESGLADHIIRLQKQGVFIIGICGGYQMLGEYIYNPDQVESTILKQPGLALLPITTTFLSTKETHQVKGKVVSHWGLLKGTTNISIEGYEIHMGRTESDEKGNAFHLNERSGKACNILDGYLDSEGRVLGTYIHGLFRNRELRRALLSHIAGIKEQVLSFDDDTDRRQDEYDKLADLVRNSLNMDTIYSIVGLKKEPILF